MHKSYELRRRDREVLQRERILDILSRCNCCRLAFSTEDGPYIVPLSFGFEAAGDDLILYFHSAPEGRKLDCIRAGGPVGFELDTGYALHPADNACGYSAAFQSVIGAGHVDFLMDSAEKEHALNQIMRHYSGRADWDYPQPMLDRVTIFRLTVTQLCAKEHL